MVTGVTSDAAGYVGIGPERGRRVPREQAFVYALAAVAAGDRQLQEEFEEWFFSGNWLEDQGEFDAL